MARDVGLVLVLVRRLEYIMRVIGGKGVGRS